MVTASSQQGDRPRLCFGGEERLDCTLSSHPNMGTAELQDHGVVLTGQPAKQGIESTESSRKINRAPSLRDALLAE